MPQSPPGLTPGISHPRPSITANPTRAEPPSSPMPSLTSEAWGAGALVPPLPPHGRDRCSGAL